MPDEPSPEVILPGAGRVQRTGVGAEQNISDENLEMIARVLDDVFQIPGTNIRFGLDALVGLIPGFGDLLTSIASMLMIYAGWERGLPRVTIARMLANVGIDAVVGAIPLLGDVFDVAWKANRKNYELLTRGQRSDRKQTVQDWLFLLVALFVVAGLAALPFVLIWLVIRQFWS
jgi:hypothetical protein